MSNKKYCLIDTLTRVFFIVRDLSNDWNKTVR